MAEVKACAAALEASRPRVDQVSKTAAAGSAVPKVGGVVKYKKMSIEKPYKNKKSNGDIFSRDSPVLGPVAPSMGPMGMAQISAQELLEHILATVARVLGESEVAMHMNMLCIFCCCILDLSTACELVALLPQKTMLWRVKCWNHEHPHQNQCLHPQEGRMGIHIGLEMRILLEQLVATVWPLL